MFILTSLRCLVWGHELVREVDRDRNGRIERVRLSCMHCPKRTPGWTLNATRERQAPRSAIGETIAVTR
jgi:hypothetical protein